MIIDTFEVSDEPVFNLTEEYLRKRYNEFNDKYFDGALPRGLELNIVSSKGNTLATTHSFGQYNRRSRVYIKKPVCSISMNVFFQRNEKTYCSTLLHEMIHVYEATVLLRIPDHANAFYTKMNEINRVSNNGWGVSVRETVEEHESRGSAPQATINLIQKSYVIWALNKANFCICAFMTKASNLKEFDWLKKYYPDYRIYKITDGNRFAQWKVCRTKVTYNDWQCKNFDAFEKKYEGCIEPIDESAIDISEIDKRRQSKIKRIEKNCYLCYTLGFAFLVLKEDVRNNPDTMDMLERYSDLRIFKILDGAPFVNLSTFKDKVSFNKYMSKGWIEEMIKNNNVEEFDYYELFESKKPNNKPRLREASSLISQLEQDPMRTVNGIKKVDDDIVELDVEII